MPYQPGESGNPGGRPKTASLSKAYRGRLDKPVTRAQVKKRNPEVADLYEDGWTTADAIAANLSDRAMRSKDPVFAAKELADRAEGKSPQAIDLGLTPEMFKGESKGFLVDLIVKGLARRKAEK